MPQTLSQENAWTFGTHSLNSVSLFGGRELHIGYMAILHGSGVIGISLFFLIIIMIYMRGKFYYKRGDHKIFERRVIYALYLSLAISLLAYLLTSRLHGFNLTRLIFLINGSILGCFQSENFNKNLK